jgi:hypothetical protein
MTMLTKSHGAMPLPESLLQAQIRGNIRYPQTNAGTRLLVGSTAMQLMLAGEYTWDELRHSEPTNDQFAHTNNIVTSMHKRFGVPCRLDSGDHSTHYTHARLAEILGYWKQTTSMILRDYAEIACKDEVKQCGTDWLIERNRLLSEILLEQSPQDGSFRPEAVALGALWQTAADLAFTGPGQKIANKYRDAELRSSGLETLEATDALGLLIGDGLRAALPEIREASGAMQLPDGVIRVF